MDTLTLSRTRWLPFVLAFVAMLAVMACGGDNATKVDKSAMAPPDQQILRLRLNGEPKTIDPALSNSLAEATLTRPLFAGLFSYDTELKIIPNMATDVPTDDNGGISKDGLTYTVKIKKDAKWSDGNPITANDFVYSLRRALDPKLGSPYVSFYYGIVGAQDYNTAFGTKDAPKTPGDSELSALRDKVGVEAKDATTVVYHLKQPDPSFLNLLALWTAYPVEQKVVEQYGAKWTEAGNHVGNGPFVLREWAHDQRIVFEPNPYWTGEKPNLSRIVISFIADDAAAYAAFQAGDLDVVTVPPAASRQVAAQNSAEFVKIADLSTYAMFMNNKVAPFDNQKVREAFALAVDRNAYVDGVLQGAGAATTSWIPPGMPGYDANLGKQWTFDATKAKQALAEAGYPDGKNFPAVTFLAVSSDTNRLVGQFIEDQLKKNLGVTVTTEYVDSKTFGGRFTGNQHQVTIQRWSADWPYPNNWLPDQFGTNALNNHSGYSSSKFDDLVKKAAAEVDEKKRLDLYAQAQKLIIDEAVISPLYNRQTYLLVKPWVKDLIATPLDGAIKGDSNLTKTYIAAR